MGAQTWFVLITALATALAVVPAFGGPLACTITEGFGIAAIQIGMPVHAALGIAGTPLRQIASGSQTIYLFGGLYDQVNVEDGIVQRLATRAAGCRTTRGIGPGATLDQIREAYAGTPVSTTRFVAEGQILTYPTLGVAFLLKHDRVDAVEVFRAESLGGPRTPAAVATPSAPKPATSPTPASSPAPTATPTTPAGAWSVRSVSLRVEGTDLVVSGTVENRSATQSAYAEVAAFNAAGRRVGEGNAPVQPNPVPSGGAASFEVRFPIADVVTRFTVTIRPARGGGKLADYTGQVRTPAIFAPIVARQLQVEVQARTPNPTRNDFGVTVTNGSGLVLSRATVTVEVNVTCRLTAAGQFVQETWTGSVIVAQPLRPGASAHAVLTLAGGVCQGVAVQWSSSHRVGDVTIAEQQ